MYHKMLIIYLRKPENIFLKTNFYLRKQLGVQGVSGVKRGKYSGLQVVTGAYSGRQGNTWCTGAVYRG